MSGFFLVDFNTLCSGMSATEGEQGSLLDSFGSFHFAGVLLSLIFLLDLQQVQTSLKNFRHCLQGWILVEAGSTVLFAV